MSYFLSDFLVKRGVRVLYAAEYVRHAEVARGATVVACGNDGPVTFGAKRVVDTRPGKVVAVSGVLVARGKSVETRLFRVPLPPDANWTQARLALADAWAARKGDHPGFDLVAEAGALKRDTGFPDFFSAFEEGLAWTGSSSAWARPARRPRSPPRGWGCGRSAWSGRTRWAGSTRAAASASGRERRWSRCWRSSARPKDAVSSAPTRRCRLR